MIVSDLVTSLTFQNNFSCNKSDNAIKPVIFQVVNSLFQTCYNNSELIELPRINKLVEVISSYSSEDKKTKEVKAEKVKVEKVEKSKSNDKTKTETKTSSSKQEDPEDPVEDDAGYLVPAELLRAQREVSMEDKVGEAKERSSIGISLGKTIVLNIEFISLLPKEITVHSGIVWRDKIYGDRRQICERVEVSTIKYQLFTRPKMKYH
jgi:hypothetical protein